ncbi:hypothetical protein FRC09_016800, partial [Ceratobasidium sp. 395]
MEISPAKSLEVISDSEGEEDHTRATGLLNQPQRDPNAEILAVSRDRRHHQTPATMSSHIPSSHISQFPTMSHGQPPTPSVGSSIQPGSDLAATNPRPRPRPRMRPVPPPDEPDTSIGTFSTIPPSLAQPPTDTVSSFGNSVVQDVPHMRPPSLPPSSLPTVDSSSSMLHPTFPVTPAPQAKAKPASKSKTSNPTNPTIDSILSNPVPPPTIPMETSAFPSSKRVKPKMRPPPPPEASPSISTTAPSVAATDSSSNLKTNPSTSATSNSANSKTSSALQRSALDEAEEYTGRGARRLAQASKPKAEEYIDVGGPEDEVILLLDSSDAERPPAKPKPKQKKKAAPKPSNKSTPPEPEVPGAHDPRSSSRTTPATTNRSKRKSPQLQTSDDEFGRWDVPIPGEPSSASAQVTSTKKRRKAAASYSDDEGDNPPFPSHAPDTATLPGNPSNLPPPPAPSSPLSSPGHSPAAKRKLEASTVDESSAPTTSKKPRKSAGTMEIVLRVPAVQASSSKKSKAKPKGKGKAALDAAVEPSGAEGNPSTFPIPEVGTETTPGLIPEPDKAGVTSQSADGGTNSEAINDPTGADLAVAEPETAPSTGKKPAKRKATKGKKGAAAAAAAAAASEVIATEEEKETPTTATKKPAKGKGKSKAKAKDVDTTASPSDAGVPPAMPDATSNPDNGVAASSSNPGASGNPAPGSSNSSAQNQTPVPKASRPKPRHSTTPAPMPVAMGASGALLQSTGRKSSDRSLADTLRLTLGGTGTPSPRMGLSRRGSSKIAPLLAFRGAPPPPPPPMPKKPVRKKKGQSDDEDSEEGPEWEKLTEKQKEKKRREKEIAG